MEIEVARKLITTLKKFDNNLNELLSVIEEITDVDERKIMRRKGANLVSSIYVEIIRPIEIEHPSLVGEGECP